MENLNLFFELLQVAIGRRSCLSIMPSEADWHELFVLAQKQAMVGVCFSAIENLQVEQRPPREVLMQWFALTQRIEERNKVLNKRSVEACRYFEKQGFTACVLKGQGNAAMYPWPLRRQSGDIDVWVMPDKDSSIIKNIENYNPRNTKDLSVSRRVVLNWARAQYPHEEYDLKHIHFPIIPDVAMEVHFVPSRLRVPWYDYRLKKYYEREAETQMHHSVKIEGVDDSKGELICPNIDFNIVFQLTHLFNHFLTEGVGLRQVMDYFFLLYAAKEESGVDDVKYKKSVIAVIKQTGLYDFARAMMWVMHEVLELENEMMLVEMDESKGRMLLNEIIAGGNFGHYETRYWYKGMSKWKFYIARMRRMAHFLHYYPASVLCDIPARIKQRVWIASTRR